MIKSQSKWNQHFNFKSVFDLDIIRLYVGHNIECPHKQLNGKHGVHTTELLIFFLKEKIPQSKTSILVQTHKSWGFVTSY